MAKVDAMRLSNVLGIDLAHAVLRLRNERRAGETERDAMLRLIATEGPQATTTEFRRAVR
ncbi:hypothetical protein [Nocardia bovistercoris]|uniref:Uncharacterized protein n=1 Tax=Nocardia bovistercoris TaxID=2785916 RepID=A0A931IFS8_9NOCA|nr:hypothetical protein [Nocardia bovistercoris]MBH0778975.1 hypothetical protein [Nocardia bovistercoris]